MTWLDLKRSGYRPQLSSPTLGGAGCWDLCPVCKNSKWYHAIPILSRVDHSYFLSTTSSRHVWQTSLKLYKTAGLSSSPSTSSPLQSSSSLPVAVCFSLTLFRSLQKKNSVLVEFYFYFILFIVSINLKYSHVSHYIVLACFHTDYVVHILHH